MITELQRIASQQVFTQRIRGFVCALSFATAAALAIPAYASAVVTLGSTLVNAPTHATCGTADGTTGSCTIRQASLTSPAAGGLTAPYNGVVVRWSARTSPSPFVSMLTAAPRTFNGKTAVNTGTTVLMPLVVGTATFESRLPIQAGHSFGLDFAATASGGVGNVKIAYQATGVGTADFWTPRLGDGESGAPVELNSREYLYNAEIEPDADGDGYGDESQDACPTEPTAQIVPCPDRVAPVLSGQKRVGSRRFRITSDESGVLTIRLDRAYVGRRAQNGACSQKPRTGARCKIYKHVRTQNLNSGAGLIGGAFTSRRLKSGLYRVTLTMTDASGNASNPPAALYVRVKSKRR